LEGEKDLLGQLRVGQAIIKLQGRIARPFQIEVPEFVIEKGRVTDAYIAECMQDIAPTIMENNPAGEFLSPDSWLIQSTDNAIALLKDVQEYPDNHLSQRLQGGGLCARDGAGGLNCRRVYVLSDTAIAVLVCKHGVKE